MSSTCVRGVGLENIAVSQESSTSKEKKLFLMGCAKRISGALTISVEVLEEKYADAPKALAIYGSEYFLDAEIKALKGFKIRSILSHGRNRTMLDVPKKEFVLYAHGQTYCIHYG